ncbi:MAG TPA: extracellular solute-binding protein [Candidatus Limnocylindrales bacterium]
MRNGHHLVGRLAALAVVAILAAACTGSGSSSPTPGGTIELHALFMKQAAYSDTDVQNMTKAFTDAHPNIKIVPDFVAYESLHDKTVTDQVGGQGSYDLVLIDTPWPAEFAKAGIVQDITDKIPADFKSGIFDSAWTAATYNGRIYGVPWINDTKFFYYNKQMLTAAGITSAPKTWDDVLAAARAVKAKGLVQYPLVWSWKQVEAVICDWTELAGAMGGADFIDANGNAKFNTGGGLAALKFMKQTLDEGLSNPASLGFIEDDVNATMSAGQAAMALNWTYGYSVMNDTSKSKVAGQIMVVPAPGQGTTTSAGVNGGMSIAVTKSSKHPDEALQYALALASEQSQEMDTANAFPMWKASFDKADVTKANPDFFAAAKVQFDHLVARPIVPYYSKLSSALQVAIQNALAGKMSPEDALNGVASKLPDLQK